MFSGHNLANVWIDIHGDFLSKRVHVFVRSRRTRDPRQHAAGGRASLAHGDRGADILVGSEEVGWIVRALDGNQPVIRHITICRSDAIVALVTEIIDVGATGVWPDRAMNSTRPGDVLTGLNWVHPA